MKIPEVFLPENNLQAKVEKLLKGAKKITKKKNSITKLILNPSGIESFVWDKGSYAYTFWIEGFKKDYPFINKEDLTNMVRVNYDYNVVDILEFNSQQTLEGNITNLVACAKKQSKIKKYINIKDLANKLKCHVILRKDSYAVFVYSHVLLYNTLKISPHDCLIDAYKEEFGFKEIKG